ncbi:MAG: helix-turn-helix transcriptional regulator [Clostridia bacterium]|nr:helix-turn-helix transcriptional regulator [Clostridia bacterium]MBQ2316196.1 helix-turn-helix transcriptional regulator [Clostridia bacterium]
MEYGKILRELREDREPKTTQSDIAQLLGTTQQYYSEYENGKRPLPIEHLITLCKFYGVSADYILGLPSDLKYLKR